MKGTAMAVVMGGAVVLASAGACNFTVPRFDAPDLVSFSCELSASCCHGVQDVDHMALVAKGGGKPQGGQGRVMGDLVGTCSRADQVELYICAVETAPKLASPSKGGKIRAMIQAKGCRSVSTGAGTDGSGHCSLNTTRLGAALGGKAIEVDGVSTGCCEAGNNFITASQDGHVATKHSGVQYLKQKEPEWHNAQCGMIGACGKEDQKNFMRVMKGMMKGGGHSAQLELLEMFNMTNVAPQQMLATILTSGAEDEVVEDEADVTEDDATEATAETIAADLKKCAADAGVDPKKLKVCTDTAAKAAAKLVPKSVKLASEGVMLPALVGFAAGASVVGLGAALMRRKAAPLEEPLVA